LDSIVLNSDDIIKTHREEARELIRGKRIVYIYHDKIDSIGDKRTLEDDVFNAVQETIDELEELIKRLTVSLNATNIIVTADHGFIYRRDDMENVDKVEISSFDKHLIINSTRRFILSEQDIIVKNIHKFNMKYILGEANQSLFAYLPKADLRLKLQGGGLNFAHGGASPQEIVVPILIYNHKENDRTNERNGIKHGKVNVSVINDRKKITGIRFKVNIFQTEKVTDKLKPRTFRVSLWDIDGEQEKVVSDEKIVIANSESDEPEKRQYNVTLTLGNGLENKTYYLRLIDEDTNEIKDIARIPFELDLLIGDFDDF
jgi:uncharacterized protein (TIGR02687 family)